MSESRKKNLTADHTTWCSRDMVAGVNLARILNEEGDPALIGKVNTILTRFDRRISSLTKIKEDTNVSIKYFADLMVREFKENILINKFPTLVESHLLNLIIAKYRNKILNHPKKYV